MNLIDKLSIISPEDAKRLKTCNLNTEKVSTYIDGLKLYNIHIDLAKVNIRKSAQSIKSLTRSKYIKDHVEDILERLNYITEESNMQYQAIIELAELLDNHAHDLLVTTRIDYDENSSKDSL